MKPKKSMSLRAITSLYVASPEWHELSEASRRIYTTAMKDLTKFMDMPANNITRPMIIDFKDSLFHKRSKCRMALSVLNNILRFGYDRGYCDHNHAGSMRHLPKTIPIPRWTDEECRAFLEIAPLHVKRAFMMALYTGQRRSDLTRLRWDNYDGETITMRQKKTGKILKIPVHPILRKEIEEMKVEKVTIAVGRRKNAPSPYILHNYFGQPWSDVALSAAISNVCKKAGIADRSIHGLRKTTASKLAELGLSPHAIAAITGHQSLKEVMNYTAEADQARLAKEAMERWAADERQTA